ncbi:MAG: GIY-YIG nuclease family protein [Patescibacteria group bacterium]
MIRWHVYLLRCADGTLYTGITNNLSARLAAHNAGKGAKYTRSRLPVTLVWSRVMRSATAARKKEAAIKQMTRIEKEGMLASGS